MLELLILSLLLQVQELAIKLNLMKKILFFILIFFSHNVAIGQTIEERNRQYVCEKLVFYYIDNPTAAPPADISTLEIDKRTIFNGNNIASPLWTNANNIGLKNLLIKILRPSNNGGDVLLQRTLRDILLIQDKKVKVYLYSDFAMIGNAHASWRIYCTNGSATFPNNRCWPCANTITTAGFTGHIALGSYYFSSSYNVFTDPEKIGTMVHELTHTQLKLYTEPNMNAASVDMYGLAGHFWNELIPSDNSAFNEGIANAFQMRYSMPLAMNMISWLNRTNYQVVIDSLFNCSTFTPPTAPSFCVKERLANNSVFPIARNGTDMYYNLTSIPINSITHCESFSANIFYQYMKLMRSNLWLIQDIKTAMPQIDSRVPRYSFVPVFKQMMSSAALLGSPGNIMGGQDADNGKYLPIALFDFYSGYKLNNKLNLENALGITWDRAYLNIDTYFSTHRATFLGYRANNATWSEVYLNQFATHIKVR
jgi:hypothetical protein